MNPKHKKHIARENGTDDRSAASAVKIVLISVGVSLATFAVLLFVAALAATASEDPERLLLPLGISVSMLSATAGGIASALLSGSKAAVFGIITGVVMALVMLLLRVILADGASAVAFPADACIYAGIIALTFLGAVIGAGIADRPTGVRKKFNRPR